MGEAARKRRMYEREAPNLQEEIAVARAVHPALRDWMERNPTLDGFAGAAQLAHTLADQLSATTPTEFVTGACRKGCSFCCRMLSVEVHPAEGLVLARLARKKPGLVAKIRATHNRVRGLTPGNRRLAGIPCAFLDEDTGACTVYPDRPLACRGYVSTDATVCEDPARRRVPLLAQPGVIAWGVMASLDYYVTGRQPAAELHEAVVNMLDKTDDPIGASHAR